MSDKRIQQRNLRELMKQANGSFSVVYEALSNVAAKTGSSRVSKEELEKEIKRLSKSKKKAA